MSDQKPDAGLAEQQFLYAPEDWKGAPSQQGAARPDIAGGDAIDMEIVANTYRSIVDETAFEDMIANWSAKLDQLEQEPEAERGLSRPLLDQLSVARRTLETLEIPAENDPLRRAVSDVAGPAVVLSPEGRVAVANVEGARAFGVQQGGFLDPALIAPGSLQDFAALRRAAVQQGNAAQAILTIQPRPQPDQKHPLASGQQAQPDPAPFVAEGYTLRLPSQSSGYVVLRSLEVDWNAQVSVRLQEAFGLSQAEAEVARLFFALRDVDAIAQARGVSRLTVRTQIKAIQSKTEAPSSIDLMRLLFMVASRQALGQRGASPAWNDPLERERHVVLEDGRRVAWTWMGAEDGIPVVLARGFPMAYLLPGTGEARLRAAGVRLYALSRPGYGNSTLTRELSPLEDNLAALRAFMDHEIGPPGIARPCVGVGMSNGVVPLLAEQQANPARFHALLAIGYTGVLDRSGINRLQPVQKTMMRLAGPAPWLAELMAKSGHRMMRQHGVDWYLERAYRSRPRDMETCRNPDVAALIRNACAHLLKQGHAAFVRDLQLAVAPIDAVIDGLTIPMRVLAPTEDGVFDGAAYARLGARNSRITVEPVEAAGELIFYQQTDLILDRIIAAAHAADGRMGEGPETPWQTAPPPSPSAGAPR